MQPSLNNSANPSHRKIQERLRHDQINVIRFLLAFGVIALLICLFRTQWPDWLLLGCYGLGSTFLALVAFFVGRFQIGQEAVLAFGGVVPAMRSRPTGDAAGLEHVVQAYNSLEEAGLVGWHFYEPFGNYGQRAIPRWAHDGVTWFEYNGLDSRAGTGLDEGERLFGLLAYRKSTSAPDPVGLAEPIALTPA